ncbi:putative ABC transport system substrate-binding protein [Alkalibacillus filiformis]|uniref:ABC transport system substrate-binding protein n=1 Tax=Alkalibacillus filiformis TaxID=200990 RepID=A0ABU0DTE5_9BACI|nr:ABC transporter substrate-binding protein [Alkalibacillus filiformis]MDQ0351719.1 putative ABC transport system substrate-binding protein [Alkalibacillus filiformis]
MLKRMLLLIVISLITILVACGDGEAEEGDPEESQADNELTRDEADFVVGVSQIVEHPSLDRATEGFQEALADAGLEVFYDVSLAQGDNQNAQLIAEKFVSDDVDLIFGNSTPSTQSALNETQDIPIVFTSVTDPVGAGLVDSMEDPGGNVTGTADMHPDAVPQAVELVEDLGYESIGLVYNSGEQNSVRQIELVNEVASENGIETHEATVSASSEVMQAAESLVGQAEVFLIITDNTVVSALESVLSVGQNEDMPVFVSELDSVERGGFAGFGFDYFDIGYEAGEKAAQVLQDGVSPGDIPASYPQNLFLQINEDAAEKMGVELTDELKERAEIVTTEEEGE